MKERYSRGTKIACAAIAAWVVAIVVVLITMPFRQPPESSRPQRVAELDATTTTDAKELLESGQESPSACVLRKTGDACVWRR